jgi:hypothetical protein
MDDSYFFKHALASQIVQQRVERCKCGTNAEAKEESKESCIAQPRAMTTSCIHCRKILGIATA